MQEVYLKHFKVQVVLCKDVQKAAVYFFFTSVCSVVCCSLGSVTLLEPLFHSVALNIWSPFLYSVFYVEVFNLNPA